MPLRPVWSFQTKTGLLFLSSFISSLSFSPHFYGVLPFEPLVDDPGMLLDIDFDYVLKLMEGGMGRHALPPVELEYPTCSSEGKLLCQTLHSVLGLISTD